MENSRWFLKLTHCLTYFIMSWHYIPKLPEKRMTNNNETHTIHASISLSANNRHINVAENGNQV